MSFRKKYYSLFRFFYREWFSSIRKYKVIYEENKKISSKNILIIGIYLTDYDNQARTLVKQFRQSKIHNIKQVWYAIGIKDLPNDMKDVTIGHSRKKIPKFTLLNLILKNLDYKNYDLIIFSDDDIFVRENFIDTYTYLLDKYQFKLAQPARTKYSYYDHKICLQAKEKVIARTTNFVEIGPIFSVSQDIFNKILPFSEESPMGYGLDYIWPIISRENNFKIGIIDASPVDHSFREQGKTYSSNNNLYQMEKFLKDKKSTFHEEKLVYETFS
ncbi:hypothetical protein [uncultured Acinetobacter sp.]|uniref:hypothetical protein n=1 Tax=uncultured Acinetobacter sp. TaxID=165433 RepID=UPI00258D95A0|nr:hypothetical protein [uncultured Acinetobacter sp.]